jgi:DNA-binding phage protein
MAGIQKTQKTGAFRMTMTRDYKEAIRARVQRDPAFRIALLQEAIECLMSGDVDTGKAILRDFIKATSGFEELSRKIHKKPESLIRMLSPKGNPTANNLFQIIAQLQKQEGMHLEIKVVH